MGWVMSPRRGGYGRIRARPFPALLVVVDEVVEAEHDDLLRVFGHDKIQKVETATWVREHLVDAGDVPMQELEGYDEVLHKLLEALPLEERLSGLTPDERVAGLTPAQRLAGLAAEERLAGLAVEERVALLPTLPVEVLRALPEDLLARLPEAVRDAIARRLRDEPR
jgi:hypothetical protein